MTHDELTIHIIKLSEDNDKNWKFYPALRAVVELHKPTNGHDRNICLICSSEILMPYPCPTIKAIKKELG